MKTRRMAVTRVVVALIAAAVIVVAIIAAIYLGGSPGTCPTYTAGPGRLDLRVVSDSNGTTISGAQVTATSISASYIAACAQGPSTTVKFTTSSAEWYPLNASDWPSGFSVVVAYSGQSYSFNVGVPVMDMVCASLYSPSGTTNSTNAGFSDTCPPPTAATSTSTGETSVISSASATTTQVTDTGYQPLTSQSQTTSTTASSACSAYPPAGDCPGTFSYTFTISVNYTGPWTLTYEGCSGMSTCSPPTPVMGSLNGTGYYSKPVTLTGPDSSGLELCAQAQKLDGSGNILILTVTGYNETSVPYGSVSYCGGVVP
jgi:hypothetical protein